jgi:hypothetical protein
MASSSNSKRTINPFLSLSLATLADADEIAPVFFSGFHEKEYFRAMMPQTPDSVAAIARAIVFAMKDPYTRVLKVTDQSTGRIVGSGQWILPKKEGDNAQPGTEKGRWADFPAYCDEELAHALFGAFAENRHEMMKDEMHYCKFTALNFCRLVSS